MKTYSLRNIKGVDAVRKEGPFLRKHFIVFHKFSWIQKIVKMFLKFLDFCESDLESRDYAFKFISFWESDLNEVENMWIEDWSGFSDSFNARLPPHIYCTHTPVICMYRGSRRTFLETQPPNCLVDSTLPHPYHGRPVRPLCGWTGYHFLFPLKTSCC